LKYIACLAKNHWIAVKNYWITRQGILWYAMEGKNRYEMAHVWNGRFNLWNGTNLPYSIQIPYLHIL